MFYNDDFRADMPYGFDNDIDINITNQNVNSNMNMNEMSAPMMGGCQSVGCPIIEPMRERCVYRNIVHEVPQE